MMFLSTTRIGRSACPSLRRLAAGLAAFCSSSWWILAVVAAAAALGPAPASGNTVGLDFEGIGNADAVGNFYGSDGAGPPARDYGIVVGPGAFGAVDEDFLGPGGYPVANEPSPRTVAELQTFLADRAFVTVLGGFTGLSFQYSSEAELTVTAYEGPNRDGARPGHPRRPADGILRRRDVPRLRGPPPGISGFGGASRCQFRAALWRGRWASRPREIGCSWTTWSLS